MLDDVSGSEQEDALAQQTEIKDEIKAVHRQHDEVKDNFKVGVSCQRVTGVGVISLQRRNSRNLRRKAVENQTEDEVEIQLDGTMESQDQRTRFRW